MIKIQDAGLYDAIAEAINEKVWDWKEVYGHPEYEWREVKFGIEVEHGIFEIELTVTCSVNEREDYLTAMGMTDYSYEYTVNEIRYIDIEWVTDEDGIEYEVDLDEIWNRLK